MIETHQPKSGAVATPAVEQSTAPHTTSALIIPSRKDLWLDFCHQISSASTTAAAEILRGFAVLRVKVLEPHGRFTEKVERLQKRGLLGFQAIRTIRRSRETAELFLSQIYNIKPTLKALKANPAILYSPSLTKPAVEKTLADWGCKYTKDLRQRAKTSTNIAAAPAPAFVEPFSVSKIRRIQQMAADICHIAKKATLAEKDEILREAHFLLQSIQRLQQPPYWAQPPGPEYYEI